MPLAALTAIGYAVTLLDRLPNLIAAGINVTSLLSTAKAKMNQFQSEDRKPTDEEWNALNEALNELEKQLQSAHRDQP